MVRAVDDISFSVEEGEIFGLLGPNGAGKTTTIKMITTLTKPTSGTLRVFGTSVLDAPEAARGMLGYVPQSVSVDGDLSAYENLLIFSKLFYVSRADRRARINSGLDYMGLGDRANDLVKHFSGGMMRRLEIAQVLVNRPRLLLLDEPSIGLDPASKRQVWDSIRQLNKQYDMTMLITTHDMSEADELCDRVAIMDAGKIAALGSPDSLKRSVGGDTITVRLARQAEDITIPPEIGSLSSREDRTIQVFTPNGDEAIPRIIDYLTKRGIATESISASRPSLDDVFMKYTKRRIHEHEMFAEARASRRSFTRRAK